MIRKNQGLADLELHAINTSGGNKPRILSETKKTKNTIAGLKLVTKVLRIAWISIKKYSSTNNTPVKTRIIKPALNAVFFKNL